MAPLPPEHAPEPEKPEGGKKNDKMVTSEIPKVEAALRKAISELEDEKGELAREVATLRRQVRELENSLTAERKRVNVVLDALRGGAADMLQRCEDAAAKPRSDEELRQEKAAAHALLRDELEEETNTREPSRHFSFEDLPQELLPYPSAYSIWNVPFRRRLQTLCTLLFTWTTPLTMSVAFMVYVFLIRRSMYTIVAVLMYVGWVFLLDDETPRNGRPWWCVRRVRNIPMLWKISAEYYPLQLVKTADLPQERNYMFCLHPHGVFSLSHAINFCTNGTGFFNLFPGVKVLMATLRQQFKIPFHREYLLGLGVMEVSREALHNTLTRGPGWSVALVPGGAAEALDAVNGTMRLTLLKRKGFVRLALKTGASLVPVLAFGENELYVSAKGTKRLLPIRLWQLFLKRCYGLASPVVMGRGVFNRSCPDPFMLPHRKPVTTVVGPALDLPRLPDPVASDVDYWHAKYIEELKKLWESTAPKYAPGVELELV
eukprot:TRINITY_DN8079_c0_g1_i2.p1 TRINITY_DN8079_c0_g1~~TRINITY_DN8079_c0_g1_i2.p1  ORF type:complete len:488 (-),score=119.50 TRINITY_DN8079_c0_g1_i2:546-2009(-)